MKGVFYLLLLFCFSCTTVRMDSTATARLAERSGTEPESVLPVDSAVVVGKLDNGLTYYIRKNSKPEKRVELRLAVNAGSILEEDDQQGLAHFVEHMAFNGTENFRKQELVNYLESIGMRFGPEINAYTGFDETVYMLQVPTDSVNVIKKAMLVLRDWAHGIAFEPAEIDKERGVVIEEWRLGRGAFMRVLDQQLPILLKGSKYAERLPIGKKEILESFPYTEPKNFYNTWYRPNLMAVIVVGDMDVRWIQDLIEEYFQDERNPQPDQERGYSTVPENSETLFAIAADSELTVSRVGIYQKLPVQEFKTLTDYRRTLIENLYTEMFNSRLTELTRQKEPPFIMAMSGKGQVIRTAEMYILQAVTGENGLPRALEALLLEVKRLRQFGFTASELERAKKTMLRGMEQIYNEREKTFSENFAAEYIRAFLHGEPIPGIAFEYRLHQQYLPGILLPEVNQLTAVWSGEKNRVITLDSPLKQGLTIPAEEQMQSIVDKVAAATVEPYEDHVVQSPLVDNPPSPSPILIEKNIPGLDVLEWKLRNGVRVIVKKTEFKNDEILMSAISPGGYSLVADSDLVAAQTATTVIAESGVGEFDEVQLQKLLAGKIVQVSPYIGQINEGLSGESSPADLESLLQLVYLYFTNPRKDRDVFVSLQNRLQGIYQNRSASPEVAFQDTLNAVLTRYHPRFRSWNAAIVQQMDLEKSLRVYAQRFADASDFIFLFVGNVDPQKLKPLVETYLGGLPSLRRKEKWSEQTHSLPEGLVTRSVFKGIESKSLNALAFYGEMEWTRKNRYVLDSMLEYLRIKLRERIREDLGGTYGIQVQGRTIHYPRQRYQITIQFGSDPQRVEELTSAIFMIIDSLKNSGVTDDYVKKIKEIQLRGYETGIKENNFWITNLEFKYFNEEDIRDILTYPLMVNELKAEDFQTSARYYLNTKNYVRVVLYPENYSQH
jgi:zinc protease